MFDKGKVEKNEERFNSLHKNVASLGKTVSQGHVQADSFYREYSQFISRLSGSFADIQNYYQKQSANYRAAQEASREKARKDELEQAALDDQIKTLVDQINGKQNQLDQIRQKIGQTIGALDLKRVAKLKVKVTTAFSKLFNTIYQIFYVNNQDVFDWSKFKKSYLNESFKQNLANVDFNSLNPDEIRGLSNIKDDPELQAAMAKSKDAEQVRILTDFFGLLPEGAQTQRDVNQLQEDVAKLRTERAQRPNIARRETINADLINDNISHLDALNKRMLKDAEPFKTESTRTDQMLRGFDQHREQLRSGVLADYAKIQTVPRNVYKGDGI